MDLAAKTGQLSAPDLLPDPNENRAAYINLSIAILAPD